MICEFDSQIIYHAEFQEEVVVRDSEGTFRAYPDSQTTSRNHVWGLREIKDDVDALHPETAHRLLRLERHLRSEGTPFQVDLASDIRRQPRFQILRTLMHFRRRFERDRLADSEPYKRLRRLQLDMNLRSFADQVGGWDQITRFIANGLLEFNPDTHWRPEDKAIAIW